MMQEGNHMRLVDRKEGEGRKEWRREVGRDSCF